MNKTEIIIIVFQSLYLIFIIKMTIDALKETLERGNNKDAKGDR